MNDFSVLAKELTAARKSLGLSQKDLAEKLNMKQSQISELEAGKRDIRLSTLIEVARAVRLELMLVPRQLTPAVRFVTQPKKYSADLEQRSVYALPDEEAD